MAKAKDETPTPERSNAPKRYSGVPHWLRTEFITRKRGGVDQK